MYIDILCIALIITIVTDLTDFQNSIYKLISKILTKGKIISERGNIHLISCSLCQTFWVGVLYLIITSNFSISNLLYVLLLAYLTPVFKDLILLIKDLMIKIINKAYDKFI